MARLDLAGVGGCVILANETLERARVAFPTCEVELTMSAGSVKPQIEEREIQTLAAVLSQYLRQCNFGAPALQLVGSLGLGIQTADSDIDFAIALSWPHEEVVVRLGALMEFRGQRPAREHSTRLLFSTRIRGRHVDLNVMEPDDLALMVSNLAAARLRLSIEDRSAIVERKTWLRTAGKLQELEDYKTSIYRTYCPDFLWLPDHEILQIVAATLTEKNQPLPAWLRQKLNKTSGTSPEQF